MPLVDVNGTQLNYRIDGDGAETVVMAHGLLMDLSMYDAQVPALAGQYRVIRYDHRGQGDSQATRVGLDMDTLCEDAAALIAALDAGPCHFVGMSMGGFMALRLAARHPDLLRSLTLIDSSAWAEPRRERLRFHAMRLGAWVFGLKPFIPAMLKLMFGASSLRDPAKAGMIAHWRARLATRPKRVLHAVKAVVQRSDASAELANIRCPTLIVVGAEDVLTSPKHAEFMAKSIENATLVQIPAVGHSANMEAPEAVNAALLTHIGTH
ncbi:MAG: alpha/beta hydrolase [Gammaproteobacteria bacterium HGW-Gammaproteobacteria-4]|jgi:pimeloyl-ACP methyl ester carboxylesterase|nr:MAG: alpha/beta hydrolase [Gammaproteobacteria bacterium HGW-Gammaproteobacteria-4]